MYDYESLLQAVCDGQEFKYLYFWGHKPKSADSVDKSCFSQWFPAPFRLNEIEYPTAEHYMMAEKARLFGNADLMKAMLDTTDPGKVKALGREVQGFNEAIWREHRFSIVVQGNLAKFSQNHQLERFLVGTGDRVLVEASPYD